jgi:hypothetical protein
MRYYPDEEDLEDAILSLMRCIAACSVADSDQWVRERLRIEVDSWVQDDVLGNWAGRV